MDHYDGRIALEHRMAYRILSSHPKSILKTMAIEKGLGRHGFNGRSPSHMRKQDFIDFIMMVLPNNRQSLLDSSQPAAQRPTSLQLFDDSLPHLNTVEKASIPDEEATDETCGLECKICTINKICVVLAKCGHTFCHSCTTRFENKCATCRTPFTEATTIRMFI
jgi:hypothetical protein